MIHLNIIISIFSNLNISFHPFSFETGMEIFILILLLICSALSSASEAAFFSITPQQLKVLEQAKSKSDLVILKLLGNPDKLLATILLSNNFINIAIVVLSAFITNSLIDFSSAPVLGIIFQFVIISFMLLLFGEIMPKVYATQFSIGFARFIAYPVLVVSKILQPVNFLMLSSSNYLYKYFYRNRHISIDELSSAIDLSTTDIKKEEKKILKGIVTFGNIDVTEIMKPRIDVTAVDINLPFNKLLSVIIDSGYSRIPVYDGTFDNVKGILIIKDLLPYIDQENVAWQSLIKTPYFVPETKKIDDLFDEFKKNKVHMAVVVDEYGGTSGIVTMEDIIEEIVGEINDESDADEFLFVKLSDSVYLFEGKILLNDFCKIIGCKDDIFDTIKGESETLAGLILELKGEIPSKGENIAIGNFIFTVDSVDDRRIKKIKVTVKRPIVSN